MTQARLHGAVFGLCAALVASPGRGDVRAFALGEDRVEVRCASVDAERLRRDLARRAVSSGDGRTVVVRCEAGRVTVALEVRAGAPRAGLPPWGPTPLREVDAEVIADQVAARLWPDETPAEAPLPTPATAPVAGPCDGETPWRPCTSRAPRPSFTEARTTARWTLYSVALTRVALDRAAVSLGGAVGVSRALVGRLGATVELSAEHSVSSNGGHHALVTGALTADLALTAETPRVTVGVGARAGAIYYHGTDAPDVWVAPVVNAALTAPIARGLAGRVALEGGATVLGNWWPQRLTTAEEWLAHMPSRGTGRFWLSLGGGVAW